MDVVRETIGELTESEIKPLNANHIGKKVSDMSDTSKLGGNSREYKIARLKRDAPDIAERVINKEISASEGARLAGFDSRKVSIEMENPISASKTIIKYMDHDQLIELVQLLAEHLAESE
jgi:hypothetical protein